MLQIPPELGIVPNFAASSLAIASSPPFLAAKYYPPYYPNAACDTGLSELTSQNPEFYKAQTMRLPTYDKPRIIGCAEEHHRHIGLPRGCLEDVRQVLTDLHIRPVIQDERHGGQPLQVTFHGELRPEQKLAADAMLKHDTGVLSATTAFGKTVVVAWLIAQRGVNTLVLVHRRQLLDQWVERLAAS